MAIVNMLLLLLYCTHLLQLKQRRGRRLQQRVETLPRGGRGTAAAEQLLAHARDEARLVMVRVRVRVMVRVRVR